MAQRVVVILLVAGQLLAAQSSFDEALGKRADHPPKGFSLMLERLSGSGLNEGELVQIRVQHTSPYEQRFGMPYPPVQYQFAGFLISPPIGDCGTLEHPCLLPAEGIIGGGGFRDPLFNVGFFSRQPVETDLNAYVPHLPPGPYRVAAVMRKLVLKAGTASEASFGYQDPGEYLVSNAIEFEVKRASDDWVKETLVFERKTLVEIMNQFEDDYFRKQRAARQIGAINRPEAHRVALEILGGSRDTEVNRNVTRSLARDIPAKEACDLLRSRLSVREQKLNIEYANFMGERCTEAEVPVPAELKTAPSGDPRRTEYARKHRAAQAEATQQVMAVLAGRAEQAEKDSPDARTARLQVLEYGTKLLSESTPGRFFERADVTQNQQQEQATLPPFVMLTAARVVRELPSYSSSEITTVLSNYWPLVRQANPEAALRSILGSHLDAKSNTAAQGYDVPRWYNARREAIRRFVELNPTQGRVVLLDELTHFRPTLDATLADLLPRDAVPPMDGALLDYFSKVRTGQVQFGRPPALIVERYLSPAAADRLKNAIQSPGEWCEPELLAYFFRAQPATAESMLKRTPWDMHKQIDPCGMQWMSGVPRLVMNGALEDYLIAHLQHEAVPVKWTAARALSQYGTARARKPLEDAFQYFHDYWKDRKAELENPSYQEGRMLESDLLRAIARGQAWLTDAAALRKLADDLCITNRCHNEALEDAATWDSKPLRLEVYWSDQYGRLNGSVAHYLQISGIEAIKAKLAQFPKGTEFNLQVFALPSDRDRITNELHGVAALAGLVLK